MIIIFPSNMCNWKYEFKEKILLHSNPKKLYKEHHTNEHQLLITALKYLQLDKNKVPNKVLYRRKKHNITSTSEEHNLLNQRRPTVYRNQDIIVANKCYLCQSDQKENLCDDGRHIFLQSLLTLLTGVRIWSGRFHIVGRDQACDPIEFSFPPIRITFVQHVDDLVLGEAELILVGCCVVVYGDNLADYSETH